MVAPRDPELEGVLQALLTGERDEQDVEVQALFAGRPSLRERFERMRHLGGDLDRIGADDRELLAGAAARPSPLDGAARKLVLDRLGPVRRVPVRLIAAAALLVAALLAAFLLRGREADENSTLGTPMAAGEPRPNGVVDDYKLFSWNLPLQAREKYVLRFREDPGGRFLFDSEPLTATQWSPNADERSKMTARMTWEVNVQDVSGNPRGGIGPVSVYLRR